MNIKDARLLIDQREAAAKALLAAKKDDTVLPGMEEEEEAVEWDEEDFEQALRLIKDMSFQIQEAMKALPMHPHRKATLENLVMESAQFLCLVTDFTAAEEDTDQCNMCGATPFTGACTGECLIGMGV